MTDIYNTRYAVIHHTVAQQPELVDERTFMWANEAGVLNFINNAAKKWAGDHEASAKEHGGTFVLDPFSRENEGNHVVPLAFKKIDHDFILTANDSEEMFLVASRKS